MRSIEFDDYHKATLDKVMEDDESLKVVLDGVIQFYVLIRPEGGMIARVEGVAAQIDASRASVPTKGPTSQEELDDNLVNGHTADPDPDELAEAQERVQVRREREETFAETKSPQTKTKRRKQK
jgi:hypothetical protein